MEMVNNTSIINSQFDYNLTENCLKLIDEKINEKLTNIIKFLEQDHFEEILNSLKILKIFNDELQSELKKNNFYP